MIMAMSAEQALLNYAEAYRRLYRRVPPDLHLLDRDWAMVNGVRIRVQELERLAHQFHMEYESVVDERRKTVERLVTWLQQ